MVIMKIYLDNIFAFKDFSLSMSYPKKTVRSSIPDEHLPGFSNFRYKKVNIIVGANASGKTTLGKALMGIMNFIVRKDLSLLEGAILDPSLPASFSIDFIVKPPVLDRISVNFIPSGDGCPAQVHFCHDRENIRSRDSYESCVSRIDARECVESDYNQALDSRDKPGWLFSYPDSQTAAQIGMPDELLLKTMKAVLMTLDPSIEDVRLLNGVKDTSFIIDKDKREILLQNGHLTDPERFSSGTRDGVAIATFLAALLGHRHGFYYFDERFSYIHSSIEKRILGIMISKLGDGEQLFFTTHNETILEENLPKHAFVFLVRDAGNIRALYANDYVQKPMDSLRRAVDNEIIRALPDDSLLNGLEV